MARSHRLPWECIQNPRTAVSGNHVEAPLKRATHQEVVPLTAGPAGNPFVLPYEPTQQYENRMYIENRVNLFSPVKKKAPRALKRIVKRRPEGEEEEELDVFSNGDSQPWAFGKCWDTVS